MDGDFEHFEEIDDDFLSSICLDDLSGSTSKCCHGNKETPCQSEDCKCAKAKAAVDVPEKFSFPFIPYDIQVGFMQQLYRTLELGKIGIFESPTGTGKSLSLICGALTWLRDYEDKQREELEALMKEKLALEQPPLIHIKKEKEDPDWITAFARKQEDEERAVKLKEEQEYRMKQETRLHQLRNQLHTRPLFKVKRKRDRLDEQFDELYKDLPPDEKVKLLTGIENEEKCKEDLDEEFLIAEYNSDEEKMKGESDSEQENEEEEHITKIYFCSRTHSQLAQFVREIQKSPFNEDTRVVALGSRQNLCINDSVRRLRSASLINDRCIELQRNKSSKKTTSTGSKRKKLTGGCPFYKQDPMLDFRDRALVEVRDIEQLVGMGREMKACPYYGTRYAIPAAQLVALPYQTLLHKSTRESCGIKLKGNIVIVDEAHNLAETISNVHRVEVTGAQLTLAYSQLTQYLERYRSRLKAKNLMYLRQILFILSCFIKYLGGTRLQTINDFLFETHMDNLNLFKVTKYCQRSLISRKLHGFVERYQPTVLNTEEEKKKKEEQRAGWALSQFLKDISQGKGKVTKKETEKEKLEIESEEPQTTISSPLMHIENFLEALTNADKDGRIVVSKQELLSRSSIKFLLLNPAVHFTDVVSEARAVIVAGGTMQPLSEFKDQLFYSAGVQPERILEYSCGHVIPPENLLPLALARGSSGLQLDFTYQSRDSAAMMDEFGRVLYNVCNIVPGGVVCFFPSYEYEKVVHAHLQKGGFLQKMATKKKIFREPKMANMVDHVLGEFTACINKTSSHRYVQYSGAVLFCVVGGKMSEGINFSDDLGRCIIMVGLPYPNIRSPELKEKMDYLNLHMPKSPDGKQPGQIHYENLCMKAVNQSIGRAIRHKGDYATILLLDYRYLRPAMKTKLPAWIGNSLQRMDRFGPAFAAIRQFFARSR